MKPRGRKKSKAVLRKALEASRGNITAAARLLGINRNALWIRVKQTPELKELVDGFADEMLDYAVKNYYDGVKKGSEWATDKVVKYWGHRRGLVDRRVITGENGSPLMQAQIINADLMVLLNEPEGMKVIELMEEVIDRANSRNALPVYPEGGSRGEGEKDL